MILSHYQSFLKGKLDRKKVAGKIILYLGAPGTMSVRMQSSKAPAPMEVEIAPREQKSEGVLPAKPKFEPLKAHEMSDGRVQFRKVSVPPHRYTPLKKAWMEIYTPVYEQMKIDIRMNLKARKVELKTRSDTPDISNLQKCADFVHAFMLGFDVIDAIALLRLDELYVESFEIKDVKTLRGEHLSRAIGRLSGKGGKTKFAIENATKTRIVIADTKIHILGSFQNIKVARDSLCSLILGSPAGKVGKAVAKPGNGRAPCKSLEKKNYYYMKLVLQVRRQFPGN
uniref:K Homology domain-containing protein n=1 Tax=Salix viminalis TaxID=40686 RepID=A0A6N2L8H6_SALVM